MNNYIEVKFLPATDFKGARVKVTLDRDSITNPYQYEITGVEDQAMEHIIDFLGRTQQLHLLESVENKPIDYKGNLLYRLRNR